MIALLKFLDGPWEDVRGFLRSDLEHLEAAINQRWAAVFGDSNKLTSGVIGGDATPATRAVTNTGAGNTPKWDQINLSNGVKSVLPTSSGGTGLTSYTTGDLLYASSASVLSKLADVATGNAVISGGITTAPLWGKIGLTTHVSGTLPIGNGGTGQITAILAFNALSPLTTIGDLLYYDGSNNVRLPKDMNATRYLSNTGASNIPAWAQVDVSNGVTGRLPFANLVQISAISRLVGRGSAAGAGDAQEITLGAGLSMTGTVLSSTGGSGSTWSVLTNGDSVDPELIFAGGDVIMTSM